MKYKQVFKMEGKFIKLSFRIKKFIDIIDLKKMQ